MDIKCCLCGGELRFWGTDPEVLWGYGNNPDPLGVNEDDRCCDDCNSTQVIPARLGLLPPRGPWGAGSKGR